MNKNSIVQISSKGVLDKSLNGCVGFIKESNDQMSKVNIYYPSKVGENAYVKTYEVPTANLTYVGEPKVKPL